MNPAEEISSLYLRFNGFFQLPEFTIFRTSAHQHVDILARQHHDASQSPGF